MKHVCGHQGLLISWLAAQTTAVSYICMPLLMIAECWRWCAYSQEAAHAYCW